jgi:hypothetical protein
MNFELFLASICGEASGAYQELFGWLLVHHIVAKILGLV